MNNTLIVSALSLGHLLAGGVPLAAQSFSAGLNDDQNAFDAPIPGLVGADGEGITFPGYENPDIPTWVNPIFLAWADEVAAYDPVLGTHSNGDPIVLPIWQVEARALGEATGDNYSVVSLGELDADAIAAGRNPGSITLKFLEPIRNFTGTDFAVYENGLFGGSDMETGFVFSELAYVEVSSNGVDFARFPSVSLTDSPVGLYGGLDARKLFNLAGKHANGWGTPFDLGELLDHELVESGLLNLDAVTHIRVVDVPGSGDFLDSLGNPIYDAWVTYGSGGFDLESLGAVGQALTYEEWNNGRGFVKSADTDGDGWTNLEEYAYRLNPLKRDGFAVARMARAKDGQWAFVFPRDERNADVSYVIETQVGALEEDGWEFAARFGPLTDSQLDSEVFSSFETQGVAPQVSIGVLQNVFVTLADSDSLEAGRFFRVRVEEVVAQ
ncbi:MAG: hypothetical protein ACQKBV_12985 [Puniceicoccales bacterium]